MPGFQTRLCLFLFRCLGPMTGRQDSGWGCHQQQSRDPLHWIQAPSAIPQYLTGRAPLFTETNLRPLGPQAQNAKHQHPCSYITHRMPIDRPLPHRASQPAPSPHPPTLTSETHAYRNRRNNEHAHVRNKKKIKKWNCLLWY